MNKSLTLLSAACVLLCVGNAKGAELAADSVNKELWRGSAYTVEAGYASVMDTYLSPLKYTGQGYALGWTGIFPFHCDAWDAGGGLCIGFDMGSHPRRGSKIYNFEIDLYGGLNRRTRIASNIMARYGADLGLKTGALYIPTNGNNPASATAWAGLALEGSLQWKFRIGKRNAAVSEALRLPSVGVFFSPEYAEPYYEIYLGNRRGLTHLGWWGNRFNVDNLVSLDLDVGKVALSLGYRFMLESSWINNINRQIMRHTVVIGIKTGGL